MWGVKQHQQPQQSQPKCQLPNCQALVTTDGLQGDILKRSNYPALGRTCNAACYKIEIGNRECPLLEVKPQSALVPWYSEERGAMKDAPALGLTGQAKEFCSRVNSRKTSFVGQRKVSMSKFKLFGQWKWQIFIMFNPSRSSLFFSKICSYVSLVLKAFYNSLRHSLL